MADFRAVFVIGLLFIFIENSRGVQYFGKLIGKLSELHHGVSGEVYAVDARTLFIKDFTYDGQGPAAYFYASVHKAADKNGFRLRDESGSGEVIRRYRKEGITLTLPEGKNIHNIKIFYLWCEEFDVNFGDVKIPRNFDHPRPQKIDQLKGVHAISSDNVVIVDAQTLLVPNLSYDGQAPDAKFWVGRGAKPSPQGIRVSDENGKMAPLKRYERKTIVLTLPGDLTVFDIGHFGIWCEQFTVDFGHVLIPQGLNVPPSLKMLGVSPQSKLNCEVLFDDLAFEVRWAVAGDSIVLQLVAKLEDGEYMSFGLSGDDTKTVMIGGDVVVAWVDKDTQRGYAEDYYLEDKSQCSGPTGSCPDNRLTENTDSIRLLNAAMVNGYSIVTYQRPLRPSDQFDRRIFTNHSQAIIWAIGPLNQRNEVSFHSKYLKENHLIDFGRQANWNCPMPDIEQTSMAAVPSVFAQSQPSSIKGTSEEDEESHEEYTTPKITNGRRRGPQRGGQRPQENVDDSQKSASRTKEQSQVPRKRQPQREKEAASLRPNKNGLAKRDAWTIPPIKCNEPEDGVLYAQMGPTGGKRGYPAITGHVGWGISWYINGLLIPEIYVVRGNTYTFVVEGGLDPEISAKYHPFYITDDPVGGYEYKTPEERKNITIFAGARKAKDGSLEPTGTGRLCHWTETNDQDADDYPSFGAYQRTLELKCDAGEPGIVEWTPNKNTPNTVYYQCFTHRYLGWKIHVVDSCDEEALASEPKPAMVPAPQSILDKSDTDLEDSSSLLIETRVKQNNLIKEDNEDKDIKSIISDKVKSTPSTMPQEHLFRPLHLRNGPDSYHYHPQNLHYFKPSTLLNTGIESTKISSIHTTTSTTSSTTSTTEKPTTPKLIDNLAVASDNLVNDTFLVPPPVQLYRKNIVYRRPVNYLTMPKKIPPPRYFNKPHFRIPSYRYKPTPYVIYARPPPPPPTPSPVATKPPVENQMKSVAEVMNIEMSPQQPSTEKEPVIQTAPSISLVDIVPDVPMIYNNGFKPGSIKIESGFKPIIAKEFQDRMDEEEPLVEYESEKGVILINETGGYETKPTHSFQPMFIPSPAYKPSKKVSQRGKKRQVHTKVIVKRARSLTDDLELEAQANERVDSYYLPPTNKQPVEVVREPSNIDIDLPEGNPMLGSPPDVVITYDGRKLSGQSLTAKLSDRPSVINHRLSKASAFVASKPQFGRFRGELPPLNIDFINKNAPQLQTSVGVINRELDTPLPAENEPIVVSTKLRPVRSYDHK